MTDKLKNIFWFFLRFGLSFLLLGYLFKKIDFQKTQDVLKSADLNFILFAFLFFIFIHVLLLIRWHIFIRALDLSVSIFDMVRYFFIGLFGNLFLPSSIGGDIIKILGLCKGNDQKAKVVASVVLDRLSGFAGIVVVAVTVFTFGYGYVNEPSLLIPIVVIAAASILIAAFLFNTAIYSFGCRIFNAIPKIKDSLMKMHHDIGLLNNRKLEGFKAIGMSCLSQATLSVVFFLIAKAFHQDINFIYFLIFIPLICVASSLPSIGGLGIREAGAAYLFGKIGVDSGIAVSISLITFLFMVVVGLTGGLYYVITLYSRRVQHHLPSPDPVSGKT